jgi:hypothetical protein
MYGKIFTQIYDGSLVANWKALVTFQQFIVLSSPDGIVDMTPHAIGARTGIPFDIIAEGIAALEQPDPYSRSPECGGRRIQRLDEHRVWGWRIVNHDKYMKKRNFDEKRAYDRERIARLRSIGDTTQRHNTTENDKNDMSQMSSHSDSDSDSDSRKEKNARFALPAWVPAQSWKDWEETRVRLRKPLTDAARLQNLRKLDQLRGEGHDPGSVLSQSIERGWAGLFSVKSDAVRPGRLSAAGEHAAAVMQNWLRKGDGAKSA